MSSIFRAGGLSRCVAATALFFVALLCAPHADALELPRARSVPGGVALVDLGPALVAPQARVDGVPVLVSGRPGGWTAVVGIALDVEPGERVLEVRREGAPPESVRFAVTPVRYAEQRLKVAPGKVDLSAQDLARPERERVPSAEVIATWSAAAVLNPHAFCGDPDFSGLTLPALVGRRPAAITRPAARSQPRAPFLRLNCF